MDNYIYFSIADFIIQITFEATELMFARKKMIKDIQKHFEGFIVQKDLIKSTDYEIIFKDQEIIPIINNKKDKRTYVELFENIKGKVVTFYHISIIQFQTILRNILLELLTENTGFMLHCSAICVNQTARIFLGTNGAGKSTLVRLMGSTFKPLADDLGIVRKMKSHYYFFQTPLVEKNKIEKFSFKYPIGGVYIIHKNKQIQSEKISPSSTILEHLFGQLITEKQFASKQLHYMMKFLTGKTNYYHFFFPKKRAPLIQFFQQFSNE